MKQQLVLIFMGVSACGKTTIGQLFASSHDPPMKFIDGDDFHPPSNREKMKNGQALNDQDRAGWLQAIRDLYDNDQNQGDLAIACSALKKKYRQFLAQIKNKNQKKIIFVFLDGSFELLLERIRNRTGHFMKETLLKSQFETLEKPDPNIENLQTENYQVIDIDLQRESTTPEEIVREIEIKIKSMNV